MAAPDEDDVKDWFAAAAKFGIPSMLLTFLLWWLVGDFNVRLKAIEDQHSVMGQHAERTEDLMGRAYMANEKILYVLQQTCINAARTAEARRLCIAEGGGGR